MSGFDGVVVTPETLGGTPQTMPSNNWWDGIGVAISDTVNTAQRAAQGYVAVQESYATIRGDSVQSQNRAPGTFGLNAQASTVPGAGTAASAQQRNQVILWAVVALLAVMVIKRMAK